MCAKVAPAIKSTGKYDDMKNSNVKTSRRPTILVTEHIASEIGEHLRTLAPAHDLQVLTSDLGDADLAAIDIAFFSTDSHPVSTAAYIDACTKAPNLRWFHTMSAGVDHPVFRSFVDRGVELTTSSGANAGPIAQMVFAYLLTHAKRLRTIFEDQRLHRWDPTENLDLEGQSLLVVGMGPIGERVARLGLAFGMDVTGVRRTPAATDPCPTFPLAELAERVGTADVIVVAFPLTPDTNGIISAQIISSMKSNAFFVNVGRGDLVDEAALIRALESGALGGAGLDVFHKEPLPADSPFWDLPNVTLTPHNSANTPTIASRVVEIFCDNLARHIAGTTKRNLRD